MTRNLKYCKLFEIFLIEIQLECPNSFWNKDIDFEKFPPVQGFCAHFGDSHFFENGMASIDKSTHVFDGFKKYILELLKIMR